MYRYLRLYLYFLRFSFSKAMEFRMDFFFRIVMDCIFYVVQIVFFWIIYRHTNTLGGWSLDQVWIFTAGFLFIDAAHMTVFANNSWFLPQLINRGDLDYYLLRPISSLFFLTLRDFAANSFLNVIIAGGIVVWALARYPGELGAMNIALYILLLLLGTLVYAGVNLLAIIPTFWMHSNQGLREIFFDLQKYSERPHQIFDPWLRRIITTVLPLALMGSIPAHVLFTGLDSTKIAIITLVPVGLFFVVVGFWTWGIRSYSSASS